MKRAVVQEFCDIHFGRDRVLVPADHTNVLIHITDTEQIPTDVCDACLKQLDATFGPMLETGAIPRTQPRKQDRRDNDYYLRLQAWCQARGKPVPTVAGKLSYSPSLKREFDAYEIEHAAK